MYFANPWGLLALASLPTILVIHLYHRRLPPVLVAGLHLWGGDMQPPTAGRRRERLPWSLSLWLELLAALLLSLVLAQPRFGELDRVLHFVVVLDNSASMSAVGADGVSFRTRAIDALKQRLQDAPRHSVVTLITTGRRPAVLAGPAVKWDVAESKLEQWQPSSPKHDMASALDIALQLAASSGQVLFLTDHLPDKEEHVSELIDVVAVGQPLGNVAIIAARWFQDPETLQGKLFVRLSNRGERGATTKLVGKVTGQVLFENSIELPSQAEGSIEVAIKGGSQQVDIVAETAGDPLDIDNHVTLIEPKVRQLAIANRLPKDDVAYRAVQRVLKQIPDLKVVEPSQSQLQFDLASQLPPSRRDLWWLGIGPLERTSDARKSAKDLGGPFLIDKRHLLSDGLTLGGVVWAGVQPLANSATPIITAGDHLLLARLNHTATSAYVLNIDLSKSNLTETPDWPILISNLVEQRRDQLPGLRRWNYRLHEDIAFRLYDGVESDDLATRSLTLNVGTQSTPLTRLPMVELPRLEQPGVYVVQDGDEEFGRFAVNYFDIEESTLLRLRTGRREPQAAPSEAGYELDTFLTWLTIAGIALVLMAALGNWRELGRSSRAIVG